LVFEINSLDEKLAGQPTIIGGGHYANLVNELGGKDVASFGFAIGIERLIMQMQFENTQLNINSQIDLCLAPIVEQAKPICLKIAK